MKKSQISMEFLFTIGFVFFIFLILILFVFDRKADLRRIEDIIEVKNECYKLSNLISAVYDVGDGTNVSTKMKYNTSAFVYPNNTIRVIGPEKGEEFVCTYLGRLGSFTIVGLTTRKISIVNIGGAVSIENV